MNISSIDKDIRELLKANYYKIPRFQRPYSWEREHIEDFWNDSIADSDSDYFIGSMVVYKMSEDTLGIVDGQQRLTTITMLLGALREYFKEIEEEKLAKGIQGMIERKDLSDAMRYVIQTETSYPYFHEYVQKFEEPEVDGEDLKKEEANIKKGYSIIQEILKDELDSIDLSTTISEDKKGPLKKERLVEIRDKILDLKVIYIDLDNEDDAYIIFETLNTRGMDLRVSDLVKNYLTKLLPKKNHGVDISKDKWMKARDLIEGSNADLNMDSFLHHFWLSKYEYTTQKKLFKLIKKTIKKTDCVKLLEDISSDVSIYRGMLESGYRTWAKEEVDLGISLKALSLFRVKQQIPMVLSVMREYDNGNLKLKKVKDILHTIEYFHFIFTAVTSQRSSGGISLMYAYHARELLRADVSDKSAELDRLKEKLRSKLPSQDEFLANFTELFYTSDYTKEKKLVKYVLTKYDSYYSRMENTGVVADYDLMTIEHIYAENDPSEAVDEASIGLMGNLLLVDETLNSKLGNKSFEKKLDGYTKSKIYLDEAIKSSDTWGAFEIRTRTVNMSNKLYEDVFKF